MANSLQLTGQWQSVGSDAQVIPWLSKEEVCD